MQEREVLFLGRKRKRKSLESNDSIDQLDIIRHQSFDSHSSLFLVLSCIALFCAGMILFVFFTSDFQQTIYQSKKFNVVNRDASQQIEASSTIIPGLTITAAPGVVFQIDRATALEYLSQFDDDAIDELLDRLLSTSIVDANSIDESAVSDELTDASSQDLLENAYAEAESQYPGQINGSMRLHLIDELNAQGYSYYVAEEGDTLIALSHAFNVSLGQLVEVNGIHDADIIPAGMIILIPVTE